MEQPKTLDALLDERLALHNAAQQSNGSQGEASAALPPGMQRMQEKSVDQIVAELNRIPLFMTTLDETDGAGGENEELEALRALAYEGTRAEIAQNFREQGNELIREEKRYKEAREFYTKAIKALHDPRPTPDPEDVEDGPRVIDLDADIEMDEEAEAKKERDIEEACLINRALCELEMKNYGSCNRDCAAALRINAKNVKAWYRAASACLALDKVEEAIDAVTSGLEFEPRNNALKALLEKATKRKDHLAELEKTRREREEQKRKEEATIKLALKQRNIPTRTTSRPPEMPESAIALSDPLDPFSTLTFPTMFLYPAHAQTDLIKAFSGSESLNDHLSYILPLPWDETEEYTMESVECYIETIEGGLIKAGKKLALVKLLSSGKLEVVDGLVRVNVLPKAKAAEWIREFKGRRGRG